MGLVSEGFSPDKLAELPGSLAIGHTRYSTAGSSSLENAQPVLVRFRDGYIALAHNGNLVNAAELRRELEESGSIFSSTMDSEVLVHRIARSRRELPEEQLADALNGVEGAYSLVIAMGDALIAARDPRGWRPLVIGKSQRPDGVRLRDLRARHRGRDARARGRAGRDRGGRRRRHAVAPLRPARDCEEVRVRVRLLRASRQPDLRRRLGGPRAPCARPPARQGMSRARRRPGVRRPRLRQRGRPRIRGRDRPAARARAHPQSLRGPHVHQPVAGRPRQQGEDQVQRRARGARGRRAS